MALVKKIVDGEIVTKTANQTSTCRTITRTGEKTMEFRFKIDGVEGDESNISMEFTDKEMREMVDQWNEHKREELEEEIDFDDEY